MSASAPSAPLLLERLQRVADRFEQPAREARQLGARQRPRRPPRIDAGAEQPLARLDVADPGQQRLIEDRHLDRQPRAREPLAQPVDVDAVVQRIGAERRDVRAATRSARRGRRESGRTGGDPRSAGWSPSSRSMRRRANRGAGVARRGGAATCPSSRGATRRRPAPPFGVASVSSRFFPRRRDLLEAARPPARRAPAPRRAAGCAPAPRSARTRAHLAAQRPAAQVARGDLDLGKLGHGGTPCRARALSAGGSSRR